MQLILRGVAAAALFSLLAAGVCAQDEKAPRKEASTPDAAFVKAAAMSHYREIRLGKLAIDRATSSDVRGFAQKMIEDHTRSQEDLRSAAKIATLGFSDREIETYIRIKLEVKARDFDAEFMRIVVTDNEKAVTLYVNAREEVKHENLRKHVEKTLPVIRDHLKAAKKLAARFDDKDTTKAKRTED